MGRECDRVCGWGVEEKGRNKLKRKRSVNAEIVYGN